MNKFHMNDCNSVSTPIESGMNLHKDHDGKKVDSTLYKQIVGSLYSVSLISKYMENPIVTFVSRQENPSLFARYLRPWDILQEG